MSHPTARKLMVYIRKKDELCPMYYKCPWTGDNVLEHLKKHHPDYIKNRNTIKVNLKENAGICIRNVFADAFGNEFWVQIWYSTYEIEVRFINIFLNNSSSV